jgi:hypothetical protein
MVGKENINQITEKYISLHALPNETLSGWIKWREVKYDSILITTDKHMVFDRFLNISEDWLTAKKVVADSIKYTVKKEWVQADEFLGFQGTYNKIPSDGHQVRFLIDFRLQEKNVLSVQLCTNILVPVIQLKSISVPEIRLTEFTTNISLQLLLEAMTQTAFKSLRGPNVTVIGNKDIEVDISVQGIKYPELEVSPPIMNQTLEIRGKGYAIIRMGFEYEDYADNKYKTNTLEITLDKRINEVTSIPVESIIRNNPSVLIAQS